MAATEHNLLQKRLLRKGKSLTILVCGESGTGKHTFVNNLCNSTVFPESQPDGEREPSEPKLRFETREIALRQPGAPPVTLKTVFVPGFRDALDSTDTPARIVEYLEAQFSSVLEEEVRIKRNPKHEDNRVHVAVYFLRPTCKGLNAFDIECMRKIGSRCNLVPVIAKADTLTAREIKLNKELIRSDLAREKIQVYQFGGGFDELVDQDAASSGDVDGEGAFLGHGGSGKADEDEEIVKELSRLQNSIPFAIMCSSDARVGDDGVEHHYREFPWGTVVIERTASNEFNDLKSVLLTTHTQEFKDTTNLTIYEAYRTEKLQN